MASRAAPSAWTQPALAPGYGLFDMQGHALKTTRDGLVAAAPAAGPGAVVGALDALPPAVAGATVPATALPGATAATGYDKGARRREGGSSPGDASMPPIYAT